MRQGDGGLSPTKARVCPPKYREIIRYYHGIALRGMGRMPPGVCGDCNTRCEPYSRKLDTAPQISLLFKGPMQARFLQFVHCGGWNDGHDDHETRYPKGI